MNIKLNGWGQRGSAAATFAARLTFLNLSRKFDENVALDGVSLDIDPGETICLLGPSGCGKTTLLRIAAGIERPDSGRVLFNNSEVVGPDVFMPPEQRGVGLMFQDFALFPHLTILQNVMFGLQDVPHADGEQMALATLERVGLGQYAKDFPHILSGGEQQRVALARAIAPRPSILLMDEPFSGLDPQLREKMREETLSILHEIKATSMIVTHQGEEAMRMGDRIVMMRDGVVEQFGTSRQIYDKPASLFVARIFSEINEIKCIAKDGEIDSLFGRFPTDAADGDKVVLGVRYWIANVHLTKPLEEHSAEGRIVDRKFLGDAALLEIAVEGLDTPLKIRMREGEAPSVGTDVFVDIDRDKVILLAG